MRLTGFFFAVAVILALLSLFAFLGLLAHAWAVTLLIAAIVAFVCAVLIPGRL